MFPLSNFYPKSIKVGFKVRLHIPSNYSLCNGFRQTKQSKMIIFESFWPLLKQALIFLRQLGVVGKIGSSLKPNHHNQVQLVQIPDTVGFMTKNEITCKSLNVYMYKQLSLEPSDLLETFWSFAYFSGSNQLKFIHKSVFFY